METNINFKTLADPFVKYKVKEEAGMEQRINKKEDQLLRVQDK